MLLAARTELVTVSSQSQLLLSSLISHASLSLFVHFDHVASPIVDADHRAVSQRLN